MRVREIIWIDTEFTRRKLFLKLLERNGFTISIFYDYELESAIRECSNKVVVFHFWDLPVQERARLIHSLKEQGAYMIIISVIEIPGADDIIHPAMPWNEVIMVFEKAFQNFTP